MRLIDDSLIFSLLFLLLVVNIDSMGRLVNWLERGDNFWVGNICRVRIFGFDCG